MSKKSMKIDKKKQAKQKQMRSKKNKFNAYVKKNTGKGSMAPIGHKPMMIAGGAGEKA